MKLLKPHPSRPTPPPSTVVIYGMTFWRLRRESATRYLYHASFDINTFDTRLTYCNVSRRWEVGDVKETSKLISHNPDFWNGKDMNSVTIPESNRAKVKIPIVSPFKDMDFWMGRKPPIDEDLSADRSMMLPVSPMTLAKKLKELTEISEPLIQFINDNCQPRCKIVIDKDSVDFLKH